MELGVIKHALRGLISAQHVHQGTIVSNKVCPNQKRSVYQGITAMAVREFQTLLMVNALLDTSALREAMFPRPAHEDLLQIPREIKMCLIVNRAVQDIIVIQMPSLLKRGNVTLVMFASWALRTHDPRSRSKGERFAPRDIIARGEHPMKKLV